MVTVKDAFDAYCKERGLGTPTGKDYKHAGRLINTHFRKYWGLDKPIEVINSARYTTISIGIGKIIIVFEYPDAFLPEMFKRIEVFFQLKAERFNGDPKPNPKPAPVEEKKKRKRIPMKQSPSFSLKDRSNEAF